MYPSVSLLPVLCAHTRKTNADLGCYFVLVYFRVLDSCIRFPAAFAISLTLNVFVAFHCVISCLYWTCCCSDKAIKSQKLNKAFSFLDFEAADNMGAAY